MNAVEQRIHDALGETPRPSLWESLIALFRTDREAFYLLACDGVSGDAAPRLMELAELARRVREAVRGSYQLELSGDSVHLVGSRVDRTFIPASLADEVTAFLRAVDGKGTQDFSGKDYEGTAVSEAEARFQLGDRTTWEAERRALNGRLDARPLVLRLDSADVDHLTTQPRYVTFNLKECARRTVLAPVQVFSDLNRGERVQDNLRGALAICGKPRQAVDNSGRLVPPPNDMVFVVYADAEGYVFDWDWVEENTHEPGCPVNRELRFGDPIALNRDVSLELPEPFGDPQFDWTRACYSPRGDCIFCYISDDLSYACRINSDLTVFRSLRDRQTITGFKIKNVRRILEEDKDIVLDDDPDLIVSVESALLAILKGHRDAQVSVYAVCIGAFRKVDPPKVRVPKRRAGGRALEAISR
jgi:hypothetical protein